jgi:peroxiredoxin Q/BCP
VILGASFDPPSANDAFREKFGFPYDLLSDEDKTVAIAYGAAESADAGYPKRISYLIDPDGRIARVYGDVTPADHPDQVLRDLG